jgi:DNA polymerase-3 subunit delta
MKATLTSLRKDLKAGKQAKAYLFHGPESFLVDRAYEQTIQGLLGGEGNDFNLEVLTAAETSPQTISSSLAQLPLLGGRRVVAVRHLEEVPASWQAELIPAMAAGPPSSSLVLTSGKRIAANTKFYKALSKEGVVVDCLTPGEEELLRILDTEAKNLKQRIGEEAGQALLARVGANLSDLVGELQKLALFVHPAEEITLEDVKSASAAWRGYSNFDLGDAVGARDGLKAVTILHHLLQADERIGPALVGVLGHRLRTWWQARALLDQGHGPAQAARAMKGSPRWNREYVDQAASFSTWIRPPPSAGKG